MALNISPEKITTKFGLAALLTLAFESLFLFWFGSASDSLERIAAGSLATLVLVVFLFRTFSTRKPDIDANAMKLVGKWEVQSESQKGSIGEGELNISFSNGNLSLAGVLSEGGEQIGTFASEVTRVNENRLIFYYVLRDRKKMENMDAVSIVIFDPNDPTELQGDWIVASKTPRHGTVKYRKVSDQPADRGTGA